MTRNEAMAIVAGLKFCFDFNIDYYVFSPGDDYNTGNLKENDRLLGLAVGLVNRIENQLEFTPDNPERWPSLH